MTSKQILLRRTVVTTLLGITGTAFILQLPQSQVFGTSLIEKPIPSLKTVPVPGPSDEILAEFLADKKTAIQLGKALFWEVKVGSDNKTACATCHFHAGADPRTKNQMNPNLLGNDKKFDLPGSGPNYRLNATHFPLTIFPPEDGGRLDIPDPLKHYNDIVGSQGVFKRNFISVSDSGEPDECTTELDEVFHAGKSKINTRRNEDRNTPTVINAVFNFRNFWDGRANNVFQGIDPFGLRNEGAFIWKMVDGKLEKVSINVPTSSLASQASAPPLSAFEMSCAGRLFHQIGKKLLDQQILSSQFISRTDSVLASFSRGVRPTYEELIEKAFKKQYWSDEPVGGMARVGSMDHVDPPVFPETLKDEKISQIQANFALFYGLSIQLYLSTLVSDDAPFDRFAAGDTSALTEQQVRGLALFNGKGRCVTCHSGAEFTNASYSSVSKQRLTTTILNGKSVISDTGFFNIGVTPISEDPGLGGKDPFTYPLSETRMVQSNFIHLLGDDFDPSKNPSADQIKFTGIDGAFKVPSLRNVELTGPYFHNGGKSTLIQVVELYDRGGDYNTENPFITPVGFTTEEENDLVAFLLSLTDERVRFKRAPFDHPSLCFPHGHKGDTAVVFEEGDTRTAKDIMECIPAVGAEGVAFRHRLRPFLNLDPFDRGPNSR